MLNTLKKAVPLFQKTIQDWNKDNCSALGAALAYYALFSLFPLLLIMLSLIGFVYSSVGTEVNQWLEDITNTELLPDQAADERASDEIFAVLRNSVSEQAANQIEEVLGNLEKSRRGAGLIGFAMLLVSASGAFGQLDRTFNIIWKVHQQEQPALGVVGTVLKVVQKKLFSFGLVIGCAVLLFISMSSGVVIKVLSAYTTILPGNDMLWGYVHTIVSFLILAFTLMLLFKYLPDMRVRWRDVWMGGLLTAILFTVLVNISSFVISQSNFESYGVLGGIMAFLLWIFLSSQVIFFGGEFTHSYARLYGSLSAMPPEAEEEAAEPDRSTTESAAPGSAAVQSANTQSEQAVTGMVATSAGIGFLGGMVAMLALSIAGLVHSSGQVAALFRRKKGEEQSQ